MHIGHGGHSSLEIENSGYRSRSKVGARVRVNKDDY